MDPVALFRKTLPLDSKTMADLPPAEKQVSMSVMFKDGTVYPEGTKLVWPYACSRK